jgi:regulatory protein
MSMPAGEQMEYNVALKRAAALCSKQEQCSHHIREKLKTWNVSYDDAEKIIEMLKKEKFLDDQRYATFYVRDKFRFNGWGKIKMAVMLRQKGIPEVTIDEALNQIDQERYFQLCHRLISEKSASLKETNLFKRKGKLFRFAAQRGFESDLIHRILNMEDID